MAKTKLSVVVSRRLPEATEARLAELFDVYFNPSHGPMAQVALKKMVAGRQVLVTSLNDAVDADLMDAAGGSLKMIANFGSGTDHIDVEAAHERGILVSNAPAGRPDDTADMTIALMIMVMRRFKEASSVLQSDDWSGWSPTDFLGRRLRGKTLGLLGMGRIGQAVAERAKVFGLKTVYFSRRRLHPETEGALSVEYVTNLDQMLKRVDVLSLHCPLTPKTQNILDARRIGLMRPSAFVINTSRSELVDEVALADALRAERLAGAGLDVFDKNARLQSRLQDMENVMLLPHMSSATHETREEMGDTLIANIKAFEDGHPPPNRVLPLL